MIIIIIACFEFEENRRVALLIFVIIIVGYNLHHALLCKGRNRLPILRANSWAKHGEFRANSWRRVIAAIGPRTPNDASPSDFAMKRSLICLRIKL